jgi:hypothetical protein
MAMIVSPVPLVDMAPDLSMQKFVLRILWDTVWNEIFQVIPAFVRSLRANCDLATILSSHFSGKLQQHMHCLGIYAK